jgi:DNA-directed RNA polymerase III subunit RPC6
MWTDKDVGYGIFDESSTDSGEERKRRSETGKNQARGRGTTLGSGGEDQRPTRRSSKKVQPSSDRRRKRKRDPRDLDSSDEGSDTESDFKSRKKRKPKSSNDGSDDEDRHELKRTPSRSSRSMAKSVTRSKVSDQDSQSETHPSAMDVTSEEEPKVAQSRSKSRKSTKLSRSKKKARTPSPLPATHHLEDKIFGGAYVYRAVRQERVALGWSEAPCGRCPVFDFCKEGGPVGPSGCEYYGEWLKKATIIMDS